MANKGSYFEGLRERILFVFPRTQQKEIARKLGVSADLVSVWKKGKSKPTLEMIEKISVVTNSDLQWLLTGKSTNIDFLLRVYRENSLPNILHSKYIKLADDELKKFSYGVIGDPEDAIDEAYDEAANRYYFLATNDCSSIDPSKHKRGVWDDGVTKKLSEAGYTKFSAGYQIRDDVTRDYVMDNALIKVILRSVTGKILDAAHTKSAPSSKPGAGLDNASRDMALNILDIQTDLGKLASMLLSGEVSAAEIAANLPNLASWSKQIAAVAPPADQVKKSS